MNPVIRWFCLLAGCGLVVLGMKKLYEEGDWIPLILGVLIVMFSVSGMLKDKQRKQ